jgi:hypothetical protein
MCSEKLSRTGRLPRVFDVSHRVGRIVEGALGIYIAEGHTVRRAHLVANHKGRSHGVVGRKQIREGRGIGVLPKPNRRGQRAGGG